MALDKLVDSAQLDSDLGDVADAIRAKSGGSSQLAFPAGFISEIGNIPSGGGGDSVVLDSDYITVKAKIVTVGTNTVSNATQVVPYLLGLADLPTTNNRLQCYGVVDNNGSFTLNNMAICQDLTTQINTGSGSLKFYRYRNSAIASASVASSYDAKLKSGDKYLIVALYWKGPPTL